MVVSMPFMPNVFARSPLRVGPPSGLPHIGISFFPPDSAQDWRKTVRDIKDDDMKFYLQCDIAGEGAIGSNVPRCRLIRCVYPLCSHLVLADGLIYTDDSIFWLSSIRSDSTYYFVYGSTPNSHQTSVHG